MNTSRFLKKQKILYGDYKVKEIPRELVSQRIDILNKRLSEELSIDYTQRNFQNVKIIKDAISFWENIEIGG